MQFQQQPKQATLEGMHLTPEVVRRRFDESRIPLDGSFSALYSNFQDDIARTDNMKKVFEQELVKERSGSVAEALVFSCIKDGALGSKITARGSSLYDDLFKGADIIIESGVRQMRDPIISSIDVTTHQQNIADPGYSAFEKGGVIEEVGLDKKLRRVKRHLHSIADISSEEAIGLNAWIQSGGLSQKRGSNNEKFFRKAEEVMLLKYYKNPTSSDEPDKPHAVLAGPQIVVSLDSIFVNKVFQGSSQEKALKDVSMLLQAEVPFAVAVMSQYLEKKAVEMRRKGKNSNIFFDMTRSATKAWELSFDDSIYQHRVQEALQYCLKDRQLSQQLGVYRNSMMEEFGS